MAKPPDIHVRVRVQRLAFCKRVEDEVIRLTAIGNKFMIRHIGTDYVQMENSTHVEYSFMDSRRIEPAENGQSAQSPKMDQNRSLIPRLTFHLPSSPGPSWLANASALHPAAQ